MEKVKKYYKSMVIVILSAGVLSFSGCDSGSDPFGGINLYSVEDDAALGEQVNQQLQQSGELQLLPENHIVDNYVDDITATILNAPEIKYTNIFPYQTYVVLDDSQVNAFALPGGYIYIYSGLMKFLDNEAALAGVIAHEIAHAEERHATERITKQYGLSILLGIVLGENPSQLEEIAANLVGGLTLLANSRSDESESDERSFEYLKSTPYYPGAIKYFFIKIDNNREASFLEKWLATHPTPKDRLDDINQMIQEANLGEPTAGELFEQRYQQMIQQLP